MDDGSVACSILFFVLIFTDAVFNGFHKAIHLMSEKDIEKIAKNDQDAKAVLLKKIIERSTIYVNSIQMIVTLIHFLIGAVYLNVLSTFITVLFQKWGNQGLSVFSNMSERMMSGVATVLAAVLLLYIILTLGILLPKKIAAKFPEQWAYAFIQIMHVVVLVLYPLTGIVAKSANAILHMLGMRNVNEQTDVTEEEIIDMVNEGHEQGVLEASEAEMITNIFEFGDKDASDIMTHRNHILALDAETPFKEALQFMLEEKNSRYPVYQENIDHIIGILYLKDAMRFHTFDEGLNKPLSQIEDLLREPFFIPETRKIDDLFRNMQSAKIQLAIVIDEYGQTSGLVAMEDILEEIVGNIMDEYDTDENHIEEKGENEYIIEGMTRLEDLEERFGIDFGDIEFETLNGYLISKLDRIPDEDEEFDIDVGDYNFKILSVENKMIATVQVTKLPKEQVDTSEDKEVTVDEDM